MADNGGISMHLPCNFHAFHVHGSRFTDVRAKYVCECVKQEAQSLGHLQGVKSNVLLLLSRAVNNLLCN